MYYVCVFVCVCACEFACARACVASLENSISITEKNNNIVMSG